MIFCGQLQAYAFQVTYVFGLEIADDLVDFTWTPWDGAENYFQRHNFLRRRSGI